MTRKNKLNTQVGKKSGKGIWGINNIVFFVQLLKRVVLKKIVVHDHYNFFALLLCGFDLLYRPVHSCNVVIWNNPISFITGIKRNKSIFIVEVRAVGAGSLIG